MTIYPNLDMGSSSPEGGNQTPRNEYPDPDEPAWGGPSAVESPSGNRQRTPSNANSNRNNSSNLNFQATGSPMANRQRTPSNAQMDHNRLSGGNFQATGSPMENRPRAPSNLQSMQTSSGATAPSYGFPLAQQGPMHSSPYGSYGLPPAQQAPMHSSPYGPYGLPPAQQGPMHSSPYGSYGLPPAQQGPMHSSPYGLPPAQQGPMHSSPYGPYGLPPAQQGPMHSSPYGPYGLPPVQQGPILSNPYNQQQTGQQFSSQQPAQMVQPLAASVNHINRPIPNRDVFYAQPAPRPGPPFAPVNIDRREIRHRIVCTPFPPPGGVCHYLGCNASGFQDDVEFQAHVDSHVYEHTCSQERCANRFAVYPSAGKLNQHVKEQHSRYYPGKTHNWKRYCPVCDMDFINRESFDAHMARRHPGVQYPPNQ